MATYDFSNEKAMISIKEYAKKRWYVTIEGDTVVVRKGRNKRLFKISRYESEQSLIADIESYMNYDNSLMNKKYK